MGAEPVTRTPDGDEAASPGAITAKLVAESVGDISDAKMVALLATEATVEEFEEALAWASGESDVMGELEKRLDGRAALVYEILTAEEKYPDEES